MSLVGMRFEYKALRGVVVEIVEVEHQEFRSMFHYRRIDGGPRRLQKLDQDRFNAQFIEVKA
jgi:hypothetical protein